ncbi:MAG TPA: glycosyltransferase [Membranihabitans sp.]|nr:glycosyltransferase [Membranihabitans sp.]
MIIFVGIGLLFTLYFGLQLWLWWVWKSSDDHYVDLSPEFPLVTVVIPVRNEAENLAFCLQSLQEQNYPEEFIQILVVDDHSTDDTLQVTYKFPQVEVVSLTSAEKGKKNAIRTGVSLARGSVIITLDGDCRVGDQWLRTMISPLIGSVSMDAVTGPVWMVAEPSSFIQSYQEMEQAGLNVLTYAGWKTGVVLSASGANLAYRKSAFLSQDPYEDNMHISSGDDVFLVQKLVRKNGRVGYVRHPQAMVYTNPVGSISDFINQRLRWAGKSAAYVHLPTRLYVGLFGILQVSLVVLLVGILWQPRLGSLLLYGLVGKFLTDYLIISEGMKWAGVPICWQDILKASLFQVAYVNYTSVLWLVGTKPRWKDR